MRLRSSVVAALVLLVVGVGCDKANDPSDERPVIAVASVSVPAANFSDTCNAKAYSYASTVQMLISFANIYANPALMTNNNGVWTYGFTDDGITATVTARKLGDGQYTWKLVLNGTSVSDPTESYSNWTAFESTSSADGKSGTLVIYDDSPTPSTTIDVKVIWSTNASNVSTVTVEMPQEDGRFVFVSNGTSGEVTEYAWVGSAWVATGYHATWTAPSALATC